MKPRAPQHIRDLLAQSFHRLDEGPMTPRECLHHQGKTPGECAAMDEQHASHRSWLESWVLTELRQVAAYLEGEHTEHEIRVYGHGDRFEVPE